MKPYTADQLNILRIVDPLGDYRNLAKLYHKPIDPVTELVQNSLAAIFDRQQTEKNHVGMIEIEIESSKKVLRVKDNGIGFSDLRLVGANRTTRSVESVPYSGFGIGLSAVIAQSDLFGIESVNTKHEKCLAYWEGVRKALENGTASSKNFQPTEVSGPEAARKGEIETTVEVSGDGLNELWSLTATKPQELYDMLLVHTALGHSAWIWDEDQRPKCRYKVRLVGDGKTVVESGNVGFPFVPKTAANVFDYEEYRKKNTLPSSADLIVYQKIKKRSRGRQYGCRVYVACEVDRGKILPLRFPKYLDSLATHRIILSIGGFPQSFNLESPPVRGTKAMWGNILALVDVDSNIVEPGRNRVSDRYLRGIHDELKGVVAKLDTLVTHVRQNEAGKEEINAEQAKRAAVAAAKTNSLDYEIGSPLILKKCPTQEQEVLALFVNLVAQGRIPRTEILQLGSSEKTYDQYLRHTFAWGDVGSKRRPKKEEGKRKLDLRAKHEEILISEFKVEAAGLAREFLTRACKKRLHQIDLLICWREGSLPSGFRLVELDEEERFFPSATHMLIRGQSTTGADRHNSCECVVLEELLSALE